MSWRGGPKSVVVRVVLKPGHGEERTTFTAPPGRHFDDAGLTTIEEHVIEYLDRKYMHWDFRAARAGRAQINFLYVGVREGHDDAGRDRQQAVEGRHAPLDVPRGDEKPDR